MPEEKDERYKESPRLTRIVLGQYAISATPSPSISQRRAVIALSAIQAVELDENTIIALTVPAGVAELASYRLAKAVGVLTAEIELRPVEPGDFSQVYARKVPGGWSVSHRVPRCMPIYYLGDKAQTICPLPVVERLDGQWLQYKFKHILDKRCPVSKGAYAVDFPDNPPVDTLEAARWDSPQRIWGHVFRAFLHSTYGHSSNCLADVDGRLWLIDFEGLVFTETTEDIRELHTIARGCEPLMKMCRQIGDLMPSSIDRAFSDIEPRYWRPGLTGGKRRYGVLTTAAAASEYFKQRLAVWKETFICKGN
jgi:hypothetical protein